MGEAALVWCCNVAQQKCYIRIKVSSELALACLDVPSWGNCTTWETLSTLSRHDEIWKTQNLPRISQKAWGDGNCLWPPQAKPVPDGGLSPNCFSIPSVVCPFGSKAGETDSQSLLLPNRTGWYRGSVIDLELYSDCHVFSSLIHEWILAVLK